MGLKAIDRLTTEQLKICHAYVECNDNAREAARKLKIASNKTVSDLVKNDYAKDYIAVLKKRFREEIEAELSISKRFVIKKLLDISEQNIDKPKIQIACLQELSKLMGYYVTQDVTINTDSVQSAVVMLPVNNRDLKRDGYEQSQ